MNTYLEKHRFCERQINSPVVPDTNIIVVIPCYNEPALMKTLQSLFDCEKTFLPAEVIITLNSGEQDGEGVINQNKKTFIDANDWIKKHQHEKLFFQLIQIKNLPKKHAGVGLARKIGMDEAAARFEDISKQDGVIVCLDADCTVDKNYLTGIENHFQQLPKATGCSIYFEHPVDGNEFSKKHYEGIINYELFLRYYNRALHYCDFPYAFHTIGSSMAVRNKIYQKQGGMNRRKAGEDFYFLHKIFPLGNFTELNSTKVIPSARESGRVPFGTGSAIQKYLATDSEIFLTYNIQIFIDLKEFFKNVPAFFTSSPHHTIPTSIPLSIQKFLAENGFEKKLDELKQHSASEKMFVKRFFNWFDGFMVLKFVHFARDNFYPQQEISDAAKSLLKLNEKKFSENILKKNLLLKYREWENSSIS
ncbi:MAG TPA: glycosyltransferase [Bacteroidia bacterium]|nr:glycosyltransferase [Bacteroidia bacterium]